MHINHICITLGTFPALLSSNIPPFTWTDQSVVFTTLASLLSRKCDPTWYINDSTLSHPTNLLDIKIAIKKYFSYNTTADISPWEAHEPVI